MKIIPILALTIFLTNTNWVIAAGFDCTKASTNIEKTICSNETLSKLDDQNTQLFKQYKSASKDLNLIVQDQRDWLKHTRNSCQDASCLETEYGKRNAYLSSSIESNIATTSTDLISNTEAIKNEPQVDLNQTPDGVDVQASDNMNMLDGLEETKQIVREDISKVEEGKQSILIHISQPIAENEPNTQEASMPRSFKAQYAHVFSGLIVLFVFLLGLSFTVVMRRVF